MVLWLNRWGPLRSYEICREGPHFEVLRLVRKTRPGVRPGRNNGSSVEEWSIAKAAELSESGPFAMACQNHQGRIPPAPIHHSKFEGHLVPGGVHAQADEAHGVLGQPNGYRAARSRRDRVARTDRTRG
jgi:hypothetical protein